jgi:predicted negative regulator of RcsB-dependent stress response
MDHCIVTSVNVAKFERRQRKRIDGIITFGGTFGWNVWKKRSKRTFQ